MTTYRSVTIYHCLFLRSSTIPALARFPFAFPTNWPPCHFSNNSHLPFFELNCVWHSSLPVFIARGRGSLLPHARVLLIKEKVATCTLFFNRFLMFVYFYSSAFNKRGYLASSSFINNRNSKIYSDFMIVTGTRKPFPQKTQSEAFQLSFNTRRCCLDAVP
jgi:hypothetical protein